MDTQAGLDQRNSEVKYLILFTQGLTDIETMSMMESNYRTQMAMDDDDHDDGDTSFTDFTSFVISAVFVFLFLRHLNLFLYLSFRLIHFIIISSSTSVKFRNLHDRVHKCVPGKM